MKFPDPFIFLAGPDAFDFLNHLVRLVSSHLTIQPGAFARGQTLSRRFRSTNEREGNIPARFICSYIYAPFTWHWRVEFEGLCPAADERIVIHKPRCPGVREQLKD